MQPGNLSQQPSCESIPSTLDLTSRHLKNKAKLKLITGGTMNDTFANWRRMKKKVKKEPQPEASVDQNSLSTVAPSTNVRGITLEQYFKGRSLSDNKKLEQSNTTMDEGSLQCDETQRYLQQPFEIHETDEDNYQDGQKELHTPDTPEFSQPNPSMMQKKIFKKYSKKLSKVRTQTTEEDDSLEGGLTRSRFPTMTVEDRESSSLEKVECVQQQHKRRSGAHVVRAISNLQRANEKTTTFTDFFKYEGDFKKCRILEKVRQEKDRLPDLRTNDLDYVTKHAGKFNIGEGVCRQLLRECRG